MSGLPFFPYVRPFSYFRRVFYQKIWFFSWFWLIWKGWAFFHHLPVFEKVALWVFHDFFGIFSWSKKWPNLHLKTKIQDTLIFICEKRMFYLVKNKCNTLVLPFFPYILLSICEFIDTWQNVLRKGPDSPFVFYVKSVKNVFFKDWVFLETFFKNAMFLEKCCFFAGFNRKNKLYLF